MLSEGKVVWRMARQGDNLNELKWDARRGEFRAQPGLFPTDKFLKEGLSVYLPDLLTSHGLNESCVFDQDCYPNSLYTYSHVAKVPQSALIPRDDGVDPCAVITRSAHNDCEAGKAHGLIAPTKTANKLGWIQTRDRLISFAEIIPNPTFDF